LRAAIPLNPFDKEFVFVHCTGGKGCRATAAAVRTAKTPIIILKERLRSENFAKRNGRCVSLIRREAQPKGSPGRTADLTTVVIRCIPAREPHCLGVTSAPNRAATCEAHFAMKIHS
jgi:hypothetical protein